MIKECVIGWCRVLSEANGRAKTKEKRGYSNLLCYFNIVVQLPSKVSVHVKKGGITGPRYPTTPGGCRIEPRGVAK